MVPFLPVNPEYSSTRNQVHDPNTINLFLFNKPVILSNIALLFFIIVEELQLLVKRIKGILHYLFPRVLQMLKLNSQLSVLFVLPGNCAVHLLYDTY